MSRPTAKRSALLAETARLLSQKVAGCTELQVDGIIIERLDCRDPSTGANWKPMMPGAPELVGEALAAVAEPLQIKFDIAEPWPGSSAGQSFQD